MLNKIEKALAKLAKRRPELMKLEIKTDKNEIQRAVGIRFQNL